MTILHSTTRTALAISAALAAALWLSAPVSAQQGSAQCRALEQDLAAYDKGTRGGQGNLRRIDQAYQKQYDAYQRAESQAQAIGCRKQGFLFFQPSRPAECRGLDSQIAAIRADLETLAYQRDQLLASGNEANRNRILEALAQNSCGPQYDQYATRAPSSGGLFDSWFNSGGQPADPAYDNRPYYDAPSGGAQTYRTICVRQCDGAFFPVNFAVGAEQFDADANQCVAMCPSAETELYVYENPGSSVEQAVSLSGQPYASHPNAFLYQKQYVRGCSCNQYTLKLHEREAERSTLPPGAALPAANDPASPPQQSTPGQSGEQDQGSLTAPPQPRDEQQTQGQGAKEGEFVTIIGLQPQDLGGGVSGEQPPQDTPENTFEPWPSDLAPDASSNGAISRGVLTNSDIPPGAYVAGSAPNVPNATVEINNGVTIFRPAGPTAGQGFVPVPPAGEDPLVLDHSRGR